MLSTGLRYLRRLKLPIMISIKEYRKYFPPDWSDDHVTESMEILTSLIEWLLDIIENTQE